MPRICSLVQVLQGCQTVPVLRVQRTKRSRRKPQVLKDCNDEGVGLVPQEHVKHCVGNFVPPEAPILMNSFENENSRSPACVQRQADGHSFVTAGKRTSEPDMVIANTTSTSSTSTSTNGPFPKIQEHSAEGVVPRRLSMSKPATRGKQDKSRGS